MELYRVSKRGGKTAAENAAAAALRGEIIVNTDASIRIQPHSVKALIRAFQDPTIGVASGRDISVGAQSEGNRGESGYVGYEMWVRDLETRLGGIVGASGCCYAARAQIQRTVLRDDLARDFASALIARRLGLRAVSVSEATAVVPRTPSLRAETKRKARTMAQGLETLRYGASLMNPFRHGAFAFALASHKLARWLVYLGVPFAVIGIAWLALTSRAALVLLLAIVAWCRHGNRRNAVAGRPPRAPAVRDRRLRARIHARRPARVDARDASQATADVGADAPGRYSGIAQMVCCLINIAASAFLNFTLVTGAPRVPSACKGTHVVPAGSGTLTAEASS